MPSPRRTQAERSRATRSALIEAGHRLFAERGFAGVPADELVTTAGVTRGALYHHFDGKDGLFRAVFEEVEESITAEVADAVAEAPGIVEGMTAAVGVFLDICQRPDVLRIALVDAPAVLGWQQWRAIEREHGLGLIDGLLERASSEGVLAVEPSPALAQMVLSMVIEGALTIAHAPTPDAARAEVETALLTLLAGLTGPTIPA